MTTQSLTNIDHLPLCVDLDGTLIANDTTWLSVKLFIKQNPANIFYIMLWILLGRAHLKHRLARHVDIDPASLPYNMTVLDYIKSQQGLRKIYLVTATDIKFATCVSQHLGLFNKVMASNGHVNLRARNKANALNITFGHGLYIYIGNSYDDLWVWRDSAACWIISKDSRLIKRVKKLNKPYRNFANHD